MKPGQEWYKSEFLMGVQKLIIIRKNFFAPKSYTHGLGLDGNLYCRVFRKFSADFANSQSALAEEKWRKIGPLKFCNFANSNRYVFDQIGKVLNASYDNWR